MENSTITRVEGIKVGHFNHPQRPTGCTVVLCPVGAVAGVDVRGAAPGTRETDLLAPENTVPVVHAVLLSGGSAYGLDAAGGVMRWLEQHGHGLAVGTALVPIVPAAVIFDLWVGDHTLRPDAQAGWQACENASAAPVPQGNVGAGAGATVGKVFGPQFAMKGGLGSAFIEAGGIRMGALVVCNALGDVVDPRSAEVLAGARTTANGLTLQQTEQTLLSGVARSQLTLGSNTTIGVIATNAVLTKVQANRLAQMGHNGLARSIRPVHTPMDGDTLFALGTGASGRTADMMLLSTMAAEVTAMAVVQAVKAAQSLRIGDQWWPAANELSAQQAPT